MTAVFIAVYCFASCDINKPDDRMFMNFFVSIVILRLAIG